MLPMVRYELGVRLSDHQELGEPPHPTWRRMLAGSDAGVKVRLQVVERTVLAALPMFAQLLFPVPTSSQTPSTFELAQLTRPLNVIGAVEALAAVAADETKEVTERDIAIRRKDSRISSAN